MPDQPSPPRQPTPVADARSQNADSATRRAALTLDRLRARFGPLRWRPHGDPLTELILTILSQHSSDLNAEHARNLPDGEIFEIISQGVRNMPAYNTQIPERDRWAIVAYLQALK